MSFLTRDRISLDSKSEHCIEEPIIDVGLEKMIRTFIDANYNPPFLVSTLLTLWNESIE